MVDVEDVDSGKSCGCICPSCKEALQARKGEVKAYHFAHLPGSKTECEYAPEIAVFLMAKQILKEEKQIALPGLTIRAMEADKARKVYREQVQVCQSTGVTFDLVEIAGEKDTVTPDVHCIKKDKSIYVEISVQHLISKSKVDLARDNEWPLVEINLTDFFKRNTFSKRGLKELVISDFSNKQWIHHPSYQATMTTLKEQLTKAVKMSNEAIEHERQKEHVRVLELEKQLNANREKTKKQNVSIPLGNSNHQKQMPKPKPKHRNNSKPKNMRYLVCDFCRYLVEVPKSEDIDYFTCPQCNREISQRIINLGRS